MTDWHPTEDDLILQYYGESASADRTRIEQHLRACPACRAAWQDLSETMVLVDDADIPEPAEGFERIMWARISRELPARPAFRPSRPLIVVGALAAVLIAFITAGTNWRTVQPPATDVAVEDTNDPASTRRVLLTALNDHFAQTELLLVELKNTTEPEADRIAFERATADDLVMSGRLYRATAEQTGDVRFAELIDDLENVLVEVARSPETRDRDAFNFVRARIDDDDLLFKVRAVTAEVRDRQQTLMTQVQ